MAYPPAHRAEFARLRQKLDLIEGRLNFIATARRSGFDPNQPRVPAGNPDGGQWTSYGGGTERIRLADAGGGRGGINVSDVTDVSAARGGRLLRLLSRFPNAKPSQVLRLDLAEAEAKDLIEKVRQRPDDKDWKPKKFWYDRTKIESEIEANKVAAQEARERLYEQGRYFVDLREEYRLSGHAIEEHVGKSREYLLERVRNLAEQRKIERPQKFTGTPAGSFMSVESANKAGEFNSCAK
jgi:hypothetical protein